MIRRIVSLILAVILMLSVSLVCAGAAGEGAGTAVKFDEGKPSPAKLGYAGYAKELDKTVFTGQLGALYSKKSTTFRLWSPVASSVSVCIYQTGSDDEEGAKKISTTKMKYSESTGTWYQTVNGDLKNLYYTYAVTIGGVSHEVVDPYAVATGVNGNRGMIVNLDDTDPDGWEEDSFARVSFGSEAVVWEVSVRDFSADENCGVTDANRGKFLAFTESDTSLNREGDIATCVAYLRELGVNYVQINPFYDFASIDESDTATAQYNWGYDPKNYNVPEGSYSSNPYDGRVRIKECKEMIQALHAAGIGVIMDVVYNHTYYSEDSFFNQIVPYYYHRINEDGSWSNGSGCGNDVATERYMVRRFIRDSVTYWAKEYHIDGFRFDLMGLMDVTTMNSIRASLDKLPDGEHIIMYGEAWKMNTASAADVKLANQDNFNLLSKRIGGFNDTARDAIKGSVFNAAEAGFVQEGKSKGGVRSAIDGDAGGWATIPNQCVNYSSCHDNLTLYDKLTDSVYGDKKYEQRRENLVAMNKLSAAIIMMSRGMPFILAGEEMARTKLGDENSYISPVEINRIDWSSIPKYTSLIDYYRGLIRLRAAVGVLNDPTGNHSALTYLETEGKGGIAYTSGGEGYPTIVAAFNGNPTEAITVTLPEGKWTILADADRAGLVSLGTAEGTLKVAPTAAAVLVDADSYATLAEEGDEAVVYVRYVDAATSETVYEQRSGGAMGEAYALKVPSDVSPYYDVTDDTSVLSGTYQQPCTIITLNCEKFAGGSSTVTVLYLDDDDHQLADSVVISNRAGQQYYSPAFPVIPGYRLDTSRLPENGAGVIGDQPITVSYHFVPDTGENASDGDQNARANIICIGDQGQILDIKTCTGTVGKLIEFEPASFGGFAYVSVSDPYATFERAENNILVYYAEAASTVWIWFVVAGAVVLVAGGLFLYAKLSTRRRKISALDVEE